MRELVCGLPVANGSRVGEGGAWRIERAEVSVGATISESPANYYSANEFSYDLSDPDYNPAFDTGALPYTSPVGSFAANLYGLFDMAGNGFQWCWDWYGTPYAGGSNPRGSPSGSYRVIRGGCWNGGAFYCRSAYRDGGLPRGNSNGIGFRSALPATH